MTNEQEKEIRIKANVETFDNKTYIAHYGDFTGEGNSPEDAIQELIIGLEYLEMVDD